MEARDLKRDDTLDLCAKHASDMQLILSTANHIVLSNNCKKGSDNSMKLSDLLKLMGDCSKFENFISSLVDVNGLIVPLDSPMWAGYNLLHLSVYLHAKEALAENLIRFESKETVFEQTKKMIELCMEYGCDVDVKNAHGQTALHLAFRLLGKTNLVEELSYHCQKDVVDENGLSHLHIACALGCLDVVKKCLSTGANVNIPVRASFDAKIYQNKNEEVISIRAKSTPLHVAVIFCHERLIEYLQESGADVYAKDDLDFTPIHAILYAIDELSIWTVQDIAWRLFEKIPILGDSVSKAGLSLVHVATYTRCYEALEKLLLNGAQVDRVVDASVEEPPWLTSFAGKTPLHLALAMQYAEKVVETLLKGGADVHAKDSKNICALQISMQHGKDHTIAMSFIQMIKNGECDVEDTGITLLHFACADCDFEWAEMLLKEGANVNAKMQAEIDLKGATPLYVLFQSNFIFYADEDVLVDVVELLLDNGADVTMECCGRTPLHVIYDDMVYRYFYLDEDADDMAPLDRSSVADLLLNSQKTYDINPVDRKGFSNFHFACLRNNVDAVKKFLDAGADVNQSIDPCEDRIGAFTPLHFALAYRSREVADLLLEKGADVNAKDAVGNTPLHIAFNRKFVDWSLIETMHSRGMDVYAKNLSEESLFQWILKYEAMYIEEAAGAQSILETFMQICEVHSATQSGFNVLYDIVSIKSNRSEFYVLTQGNYLNAIGYLLRIGYKLDQQDAEGRTALHIAVTSRNELAVDALLQFGADVNVVNHKNESAFSGEGSFSCLSCHIWKMKFVGLHLNNVNLRHLEEVEQRIADSLLGLCQRELAKAEAANIDQSLRVKDFLAELGAVANFPRMFSEQRAVIDHFFKTIELRQEFPELFPILALQYRKALARMQLREPAKEAIALICQLVELPDLCLETIVRFLTNDEMKLIIKLVQSL